MIPPKLLIWSAMLQKVVSGWAVPTAIAIGGKKMAEVSARMIARQSDASEVIPSNDPETIPANDSECGDVELPKDKGETLDLQRFLKQSSPADRMADLIEACKRLGVDDFDMYGDFESDTTQSYLRKFEAEVAATFGKEDAVFVLSGGMAQSIALLINAKKHTSAEGVDTQQAFACHPTSHLLLHENSAFSELLGLEAVVISPDSKSSIKRIMEYNPEELKENGCYGMEPMRLAHLQNLFDSVNSEESSSDHIPLTYPNLKQISSTDISTLILELPHREIGGKLTPWTEVEEISDLCNKRGIHFHCDGARIFEASVGYGHKSVKETAQPFSSIYISFYKGLGAISGAMLLGDAEFCDEARIWLRRFGGNLYSVLPYAVSSWDGFRSYCLTDDVNSLVCDPGVFENRRLKLARILDLLKADAKITSIVQFDPDVPGTNMVHGYLKMSYEDCMAALEKVETSTGIRVLSRVRRCGPRGNGSNTKNFGCRFEWTMGDMNTRIDDAYFVVGWKQFAQELTDS